MVDRNSYDEAIEVMRDVYSHHDGFDQDASLKQIIDLRDNFDIKLMLIGHFNAGKSALINGLIGRPDFLKEAQAPETAIATEIKYDETDSAFAFDEDGNKEPINPQKEYTQKKYNHLEYRVNAPALKEIGDFTIVDTPGFDSGVEAHAKALSSYIGFGSAYLVVIDQEKGGIDANTLEFIHEISNYTDQISILINKCDKIPLATAESVAAHAEATLDAHGYDYPVYTISKKDPDVSDKLVSIILEFDPQAAFDRVIEKKLRSALQNAEKVLSVVQKKLYLDTYNLDGEIAKFARLEEHLSETFEEKRSETLEELDNNVDAVMGDIREALMAKAGSVAKALVSGNQAGAEAIIIETVRPIMVSCMKDLCFRQIDDVADTLDFSGLVSDEDKAELSEIVVNLANNLKDLITDGSFAAQVPEDKEKKDTKREDFYHAVTALTAVLTDVIAPWLEVVIILLPDIINLIKTLFGESDEEKARKGFINNVIPQVMNKLYPQIRTNIVNTTKKVLEEFERELTEKIESIKQNIADAKEKKEQKIQDFENKKETVKKDIEVIRKTITELR